MSWPSNRRLWKENSENFTNHTLTKLITSFKVSTPFLMLISKKSESFSPNKNNRPNTTTSLKKKFQSFGLKYSWTVMSLEKVLKKEINLLWDISKELKLKNLKISKNFGSISTSQKMNGLPTRNFTNSSNSMVKLSKKVQAIKSSGRKARISQSRSSKRKTKRKEERRKLSKSNKNHSSTSSSTLKSIAMRKMRRMNRETKMLRIWNYNMKSLKLYTRTLFLNHWSIIWVWLKLWTIWENWTISKKKTKKRKRNQRRKRNDFVNPKHYNYDL